MDDESLDSFIKRKVHEYKSEGYNPDAFAALKPRLRSQNESFYSRYRMEILVGSSLAIILLSMFFGKSLTEITDSSLIYRQLRSNEVLINELRNEIRELKNVKSNTNVIDSLVLEEQLVLNRRILSLERELRHSLLSRNGEPSAHLPVVIVDSTKDYSNFYDDETMKGVSLRISPRDRSTTSVKAQQQKGDPTNYQSNDVSPKSLHDLEKHYYPGLGIEIGPAVELSLASFKNGSGNVNPNIGILANFTVSPSLSIETGGEYVLRDYSYEDEQLEKVNLPGTDPSLGKLAEAEIDTWLIEIPTNLKYRYPISPKAHWLIAFGYSSFLITKQSFDYSYQYNNSADVFLNKVYETSAVKFYPGALNFSFGVDRQIKRQKIEASLTFSKGLSTFGAEQSKANYFGVKSVYWIRVK
jgi:hypothetical protein